MPKLTNRLPKYRLHKASGQAVVTLQGLDHYLGVYGTQESKEAYQRRLTEWIGNRKLGTPKNATDLTIDEVFIRYWSHVESYYVKEEKPIRPRQSG